MTGTSMRKLHDLNKSQIFDRKSTFIPMLGQDSMESSRSFIQNKIYLLKIPLTSISNEDEIEFIDEEITYKMLISPKYKQILVLGCIMAMFEQFSGINAINVYANYLGHREGRQGGYRFLIGILKIIVGFFSLYTLSKFKRRTLFMTGFLFSCLCNWIIFQLQSEAIKADRFDHFIYLWIIIILLLFNFVYGLTLGPVTWSYMAEVLPARALGIAAFFHWIINWIIAALPYFLTANEGYHYSDPCYIKHYSMYFFCYSGLSMSGYFIVMVFMMETTRLYKKGYTKLYDHIEFDPLKNKSVSESYISSLKK